MPTHSAHTHTLLLLVLNTYIIIIEAYRVFAYLMFRRERERVRTDNIETKLVDKVRQQTPASNIQPKLNENKLNSRDYLCTQHMFGPISHFLPPANVVVVDVIIVISILSSFGLAEWIKVLLFTISNLNYLCVFAVSCLCVFVWYHCQWHSSDTRRWTL